VFKEEFEKLTGFEVRGEEYAEIEAECMGTGMDKARFAAHWKKNGRAGRLARMRTRKIEELKGRLRRLESNHSAALEREARKDIERQSEIKKLADNKAESDERTWHWKEACEAETKKLEELKKAIKLITEVAA
jgi:hypothetical protein